MTQNMKGVLVAALLSVVVSAAGGWISSTVKQSVNETRIEHIEQEVEKQSEALDVTKSVDRRLATLESKLTPAHQLAATLSSLQEGRESHDRRITAAWNKINAIDRRVNDLRIASESSLTITNDLIKSVDTLTVNVVKLTEVAIRLDEQVKLIKNGGLR